MAYIWQSTNSECLTSSGWEILCWWSRYILPIPINLYWYLSYQYQLKLELLNGYSIGNITRTQDALKLRHHLKFLCGDYITGERLALQHGSNPKCKLCPAPIESIEHVLTECRATNNIKEHMLPELLNTVVLIHPACEILNNPHLHLTQFLLDCTSVNLLTGCRIAAHHPQVHEVFRISRHWCYAVSRGRAKQIKQLDET